MSAPRTDAAPDAAGTTAWIEPWTRAEGEARATAVFTGAFDAEPALLASAPGRVNLIGEHTDYNGGLALPIALPHRTYVALTPRADDRVRAVSAQETGVRELRLSEVAPGTVTGWPAYVAGVAWALRQAGHEVGGFDVAVDSCVPYGSGLSSSAALECSVAIALDAAFGLGLGDSDEGRRTLVTACVAAENRIAGANTGGMDQAASLRAHPGHALMLDCLDDSVRLVPFDLAGHDLALLVVDTKAEHSHAGGEYGVRRATCEAAAAHLGIGTLREIADLDDALARLADLPGGPDGVEVARRRVRHVVTEIGRVADFVTALEAGHVEAVGTLMDASHDSLREDYEVSCRELDLAVDTARAHGALGARMTGGGFGGSMIALVAAERAAAVADAIAAAFAAAGLHPPVALVATAASPAALGG